ncbi:MAG: hypothetical protein LW697_13620, partial [Blastopirellula sp.]|nr:hypothetical protein [Blastopirellula sp.]
GYPYGGGYNYGGGYGSGYNMQGPYNGSYYSESLPGVYAPVVPEVPAVEPTQSPLVPTPAAPHLGH